MRSQAILIIYFLFHFSVTYSQNKANDIYNPELNGEKQIKSAIIKAKEESKNVLIQLGGNWCPWCHRIYQFIENDPEIDSLVNADYVYILVNYSKENKNVNVLKQLEYPQRFGFPVLIILDSDGRRLNTQNTAYLEQNNSYNRKLIIDFLKQWNVKALKPSTYHFE